MEKYVPIVVVLAPTWGEAAEIIFSREGNM